MLYISSGERQHFDPAQDMSGNLGKIVRLNDDGTPAAGNPFAAQGGVAAQIWTLGHRNPLGLAFDARRPALGGRDGPARRRRGEPDPAAAAITAGRASPTAAIMTARDIPDHRPGDGFEAPKVWWNPEHLARPA